MYHVLPSINHQNGVVLLTPPPPLFPTIIYIRFFACLLPPPCAHKHAHPYLRRSFGRRTVSSRETSGGRMTPRRAATSPQLRSAREPSGARTPPPGSSLWAEAEAAEVAAAAATQRNGRSGGTGQTRGTASGSSSGRRWRSPTFSPRITPEERCGIDIDAVASFFGRSLGFPSGYCSLLLRRLVIFQSPALQSQPGLSYI